MMFSTKVDTTLESERDALIIAHYEATRKFAAKLIKSFAAPDYMHEACYSAAIMGLVTAASRFDAERGVSFAQYANNRIRGAVIDEIRTECRMLGRRRTASKTMQDAEAIFEHHYDETTKNYSDRHRVAGILEYLSLGFMSIQCSAYHGTVSEDLVPEPREVHTVIEEQQLLSRLSDAIEGLPLDHRTIVRLRYKDNLTFDQIASRLGGRSRSWVSRKHNEALNSLKESISKRQ